MLAAACTTGATARRGGLKPDVVQSFPPPVLASYDLFAQRCSRCHTLARPLSASITEYTHWEAYVARMRRHPGSGISAADAEEILVFLDHWSKTKGGPLADSSTTSKGGSR